MAKKTTNKSAKSTTRTVAKPEPKAQTKKATATSAKAEAKQKETAKQQASEVAAAPEPKAAPISTVSEKAAKAAPRPRDPRLPAPGTVLRKMDRQGNVRCECEILEDGVRYKGTTFRSLSAAATAASKDLGLGGGANGYLFFGLIKQPQRASDPVAALEHAWERYRERVARASDPDLDGEARQRVQAVLRKHSDALAALC